MKKFTIAALVALLVLPASAGAVTLELGLGGSYAPIIHQDDGRVDHMYGGHFVVAALISTHLVAELRGGYMGGKYVSASGPLDLYQAGLGVKYFGQELYNADGPLFTRINPFIRFQAGAVNPNSTEADLGAAVEYALGGGIRWDPTANSRDVNLELDARYVTSTAKEGAAISTLGIYGQVNVEVEFR